MAGMLAGTFLPPVCSHEPSSSISNGSEGNNYVSVSRGIAPTHESNKNILTGRYTPYTGITFESVVTDAFAALSLNQEPLGYEFERVLFENLWDLYQS